MHTGKRGKTLLLLGISFGYFMVLLDTTVLSVALPAIRDDLGGGISGLEWVANAYTIVFAGLLLSMGALADRWGAKRVYMGGLALFMAASAISAFAPSLGALIAMRGLLGAGGAALTPASLALLSHAFPGPSERARALGIWAAITGVAMASGPVVGGLLVDAFGWRSIFLLQVPLAIISLALTSRLARETERKQQKNFDLGGQLAAISAIGAVSFALMEGQAYGWHSPVIISALSAAAVCAVLFIALEAKSKAPLLPLGIFRNHTVSAGLLAGMAVNIGFSGLLFALPLFFQQIRGLPAYMAGLALLPMTVPMAVNPIFTGRLVGRIGAKLPMTAGFGLAALGTLLQLSADEHARYTWMLLGLVMVGYGVSLTIPSLMAAVISSVPKEQTGTVSGALNSSRQLGATLGVALFGAVMNGSASLMGGMRLALAAAAIVLFAGCWLSWAYIGGKKAP
ncbi:DHA2 family efflux MFS transporter permease subunit [Paenibacillus thalictri]|uniref:DHA2 family efflux MFS transporter permease subunit n=2 Tax=Paenibacillus thalictri TaxID=2527873 RepID=A0A4Q9DXM7_9BACL|nr:DHA2 family efflux MFS transporter permease subunit [Paenibacillus thalictri]